MRNTNQRKAIQEVFCAKDGPLTVDEILEQARKNVPSLNEATVYRNLKQLVAKGRLRRIVHPELGTLYERSGKAHHHHFHCRVCDRVFELPGCALKKKEATPPGFVIEDHEVFFCGVCPGCA